jgi:hypothetical protein
MSNSLPNHIWEKILIDSNLSGSELAHLASTSSRFRRIIKNTPELLEKWEYNKRWSQTPLKELERIAENLRRSSTKGYWTNRLLAKYNLEIAKRKLKK